MDVFISSRGIFSFELLILSPIVRSLIEKRFVLRLRVEVPDKSEAWIVLKVYFG